MFIISVMLITAAPVFSAEGSKLPVWLVHDWRGKDVTFLRNFRTMNGKFHTIKDASKVPSRTGLSSLNISGSAQFGRVNLEALRERFKNSRIMVVDLRQESHGLVNGLPVSWYQGRDQLNWGKSLEEIEFDEKERLNALLQTRAVKAYALTSPNNPGGLKRGTDPVTLKVHTASTERELCEELGLYYVRLPVPDYMRPSNKQTDRFIKLVRSLGKDKDMRLHVHCEAGDGRTTTFLAMYDMMRNARSVSFDDIIRRQWLLGGMDLRSTKTSVPWKREYAEKRAKFIKDFYKYCKNNKDAFKTTWSAWLKEDAAR